MGKKVRVSLFGEQRRNVKLDADATEGAVVGLNLKWGDGTVVQDSEIRNTAGGGTSTVVSGSVWTGPVLWSLILSIPTFIKNLAALVGTGFAVRSSAGGDAVLRTFSAADERIDLTNGDGIAGNPTIGLGTHPTHMNSVAATDDFTIRAGHQYLCWETFTLDGGAVTIDGDLVVLDEADIAAFDYLILASGTDKGIKIGTKATNDYGWRDILGQVRQRGAGANDPAWSAISASIFRAWKFDVSDEIWIEYHIPHDFVPGTDIHFHAHWLSDGADVTNTVKWEWSYTYADGFGQAAFAPGSPTTVTAEEVSAGQHYHMVTESAAVTIAGMEVDGMIYVRCRRITNGAVDNADGIFLLTTDVHYRSHNLATKNKAPDFYT